MKELLPHIVQWIRERRPFVIARVIQTWGSSPRPVGSALVVSEDLEMAGSVSGGCVEGAVLKEIKKVIGSGGGKLLSFGVSDDDAWSVGLTCGGKIQVYLQPYPFGNPKQSEVWGILQQSLSDNKACVWMTSLREGDNESAVMDHTGVITGSDMPDEILKKAKDLYTKRTNELVTIGGKQYFIQVFPRRSQLLIIGAAHIAAALVQLAKLYDFETIVIDPRGTFAHNMPFDAQPDRIIEKYPSEVLNDFELDAYCYAVILSHDPKIDDNALGILLRSKVAYLGALGSRKTHEKRIERLKLAGFLETEIGKIESPIGMDIHAIGAKEIALSIMGAIIKRKNLFL